MDKEQLEKLVIQYKNGNTKMFDKIYLATFKVVYFASYKILNDRLLAENIMQDTYFTVFKNIDNYQSNNILAYMVVIAKNLSLNCIKKNKSNIFMDFDDNAITHNSNYASEDIHDDVGIIEIAKDILSQQDYEIVIMAVVAGYKRREISKILELPISTVSHRYKTALEKLKNYLEKEVKYNE